MTKYDSQRRTVEIERAPTNRRWRSTGGSHRVRLSVEQLESREMLAAGWLASVSSSGLEALYPLSMSRSLTGAEGQSPVEFGSLTGESHEMAMFMPADHTAMHSQMGQASMDHHDCCRPLPAPAVAADTLATAAAASADDAHGEHHDCCRPLPAPVAAAGTVATSVTASADDAHGEHHECCRPLPAPLAAAGTVATSVTASADDTHGEHHDCCRPVPAPAVEGGGGAVISPTSAAQSAASAAPLRVLSARDRAVKGDGEFAIYGPLFLPDASAANALDSARLAGESEFARSAFRRGWLEPKPVAPSESLPRDRQRPFALPTRIYGPLTVGDYMLLARQNDAAGRFAELVDQLLTDNSDEWTSSHGLGP